jgi:hypothetical protein
MNNRARTPGRPRRPQPAARIAAATVATAALALLTACGASPGGTPPPATAAQPGGLLAFSRCMRAHHLPAFPDPDSSGALPKRQVAQLAASSPQFPAAHRACEHLLPNGGQPDQAQVRQAWADMRTFARCMRAHGVAGWPDPAITSRQDQRPFFHLPAAIDPNAPQITDKIRGCQATLDTGNPLVTTQ